MGNNAPINCFHQGPEGGQPSGDSQTFVTLGPDF